MTNQEKKPAGEQQGQEGGEKQPQTVSIEDFNALKAEHAKLQKIFDERQTKQLKKEDVLKKEDILKVLGIEKDPEKTDADFLKETITGLSNSVKELQTKLEISEKEKTRMQKEGSVKELATKHGFADPSDVLAFVNLESEQLDADLKALAEKKPYLLKKKEDIPGTNPTGSGNIPKDIDQQIADAIKSGNTALSIALKNKKFGITK